MMDYILVAALIGGGLAGLLVNYLADILPVDRKLGQPICISCQHVYGWQTFLLLQKCPQCGSRRSLRSVIVLLSFPILYILLVYFPNPRLGFWFSALLVTFLGLIAIIDIEYRLILNQLSIIGVFIGIILGLKLHSPMQTLLGGIAGYGIMLVLYYLGILFSKLVAKLRNEELDEVALGFGDVNLSGLLGLILGWPGITAGLLFAILLGGVVSFLYILIAKLTHRYQVFTAIPYAPFLIFGTLILLFRPV